MTLSKGEQDESKMTRCEFVRNHRLTSRAWHVDEPKFLRFGGAPSVPVEYPRVDSTQEPGLSRFKKGHSPFNNEEIQPDRLLLSWPLTL